MTEKFLQYIWQNKLFAAQNLTTTDGQNVEVIDAGRPNSDAGPDFFNAKIKIDGQMWAGNVELHLRASDWNKHKHSTDKAYDSVILHVVKDADMPVFNTQKQPVCQMCLNYPSHLEKQYEELIFNSRKTRCEQYISNIQSIHIRTCLSALLTERLSEKTEFIETILQSNNNNWEETFYITLARNFGFGLNAFPFEQLAKSTPLPVLAKHKNSLSQIEAILFGQAGFLASQAAQKDEYVLKLEQEYAFLKHKFSLASMDNSQWKLLRVRPVNFPTVRIAQFAAIIHQSSKLFSKILQSAALSDLQQLFAAKVSGYWETHYLLNEPSPRRSKKLGADAVNTILINTVVPFLFAYGKHTNDNALQDRALSLFEHIPAEKNSTITEWARAGIPAQNAGDTQALLQLKTRYCDRNDCLRCRIGYKILSRQPV